MNATTPIFQIQCKACTTKIRNKAYESASEMSRQSIEEKERIYKNNSPATRKESDVRKFEPVVQGQGSSRKHVQREQ